MGAELVHAVLQLRGLKVAEKLVLVALAHHSNARTGRCDPRVNLVAAEAEVDRRRLFRILNALVAKGFLIRHSGAARAECNDYRFGVAIMGRGQAGLWADNADAPETLATQGRGGAGATPKPEGGVAFPRLGRVAPVPRGGGAGATQKGRKGKEREDLPYGRLDAAAAYRQALADLPQDGDTQRAVAVLINFTAAHCPVANVPGRLGILVNLYPARDVLEAIWPAILKDRPLDYAQGTLKRKAERAGAALGPPAATAEDFSGYLVGPLNREGKEGDE